MQAVLSVAVPLLLPTTPSKSLSHFPSSPLISIGSLSSRRLAIKATAAVAYDTSMVDYSSAISVFPAEACETIGGEACWANIFPEVRLQAPADSAKTTTVALEEIDREYLDYAADSKTVFPGEACDDLGGEFCGAEFLMPPTFQPSLSIIQCIVWFYSNIQGSITDSVYNPLFRILNA